MRIIALAVLAFAAVLSLSAGGTSFAPRAAADDASVEVDVSVFYEPLAQHGSWIYVTPYGWTWQPRDVDVSWRPYVDNGYWVWIDDYGWTWYSDYEWGWAPFHYGRWHFHGLYGWLWSPGTVWAPAWVAWRTGPDYIGWYPLPPEVEYRDSFVLSIDLGAPRYSSWWTFVPTTAFVETRLTTRVIASPWNTYLLRRTQDSTRYATVSGGVANRSIEVSTFERAGTRVQRRKIREGSTARTEARADGDAIVLFRPRVKVGTPSRQPTAATPTAADVAVRRERMERYLEAQKQAAEAAKPPAGIPDVDAKAAMEEHRKAIDEQRKRVAEDAAKAEKEKPASPSEKPAAPGTPEAPSQPTPATPGEPKPTPGDPNEPRPPKPTPPTPPAKPDPTPPQDPRKPGKPPEQPPTPQPTPLPVPPEQPPKEPPTPPELPPIPPPKLPPVPPEKEKEQPPKERKKTPEEVEEAARLEKERLEKERKEREHGEKVPKIG